MSLPASAYAADSITWTESGYETGSTLTAVLKHVASGRTLSKVGVESSGVWTFTLSPVDTADYPAGNYKCSLISVISGIKRTTDNGVIRLYEPVDREPTETHAAKMVRLLQAHLENRVDEEGGRGIDTYTIGGAPISKMPHEEARRLLEKYRIDVQAEETQRRIDMGMNTGRRILQSFE